MPLNIPAVCKDQSKAARKIKPDQVLELSSDGGLGRLFVELIKAVYGVTSRILPSEVNWKVAIASYYCETLARQQIADKKDIY